MGLGAIVVRRLLAPAGQSASNRLLCTRIRLCMHGTDAVPKNYWLSTGSSTYHTDRQGVVSAGNSDQPDVAALESAVKCQEFPTVPLDNTDAHLASPFFKMCEAESSGSGTLYTVVHAPVDAAIAILDGVHYVTGLPWWLTIMTSTVALRALLFPLTVEQLKKATQLARVRSKLPSLRPGTGVSFVEQYRLFTKKRQELGAPSPGWLIGVPLVQIPLFISWILAVRQMALAPHPGFHSGGAFWFADLTSPVQGALGALFPMLVAWTYFMNLQMSFRGVEERKGMSATIMKFYKWSLEAMTIPTLLIAFHLPQGVFMYWVTNNIISLAQTVALQKPFIRQLVGLPPLPDLNVGGMPTVVSKHGASTALARSLSMLAASHVAQGRREEAIHILKQAVIENPDLAEAFNALGKLHVETQQWAAAVTFYNSAIAKARDDGILITAYLGAGIALYHQGKKEAAIEALRSVAILEVPDEPNSLRRYLKAMVALGSVLHEHGQTEEALQVLRQAAEYDSIIQRVYVRKLEQECRED